MKNLAFTLFLVSACSQWQPHSSHERTPSSLRAPASDSVKTGCMDGMKYFLAKSKRSKTIAGLIKDNDLDGLKSLMWKSLQEERQVKKIPYSPWYRRLRRLNQSFHVPAFFQTANKVTGDVDTFSTIIKVVDDSADFGADEKQALEDVLGWIGHVERYHDRFNQVIDVGFENRVTLEQLTDRLKNDKLLVRDNFPQTLDVPVVGQSGQIEKSEIYFETLDDLRDFIKEKKHEVNLTFSQNIADEFFRKSRLYDVMMDQAVYVRRLELVQERLNNIPVAKLNEDQKALRLQIDGILKKSENQPRQDAAKLLRKKERSAELWATLKFWKSKRIEKQAKYKIPDKVLEQAKALSPAGLVMRSTAVLTIGSGIILTPIAIIYDDNPWVQYSTSLIQNYFNDFLVNTLGLPSPALSSCYRSARSWSIEEASTMNDFIESHLSRYTAYQRIDPEYKPDEDPEYIQQKVALQAMCLKLRMEYKVADRHLANKVMLDEHGYRFAAHLVLIDLAQEQFHDEEVGELLYAYFEQSEIFEDEEKAKDLLSKVESITGSDFTQKVAQYQKDIGGMTARVKDGNFELYYPSADDLFKAIEPKN